MRILVVEDDRLLNRTLCYNLSAAGYRADSAMTKAEAELLCGKQDYDLAVLDVNLPDGNGFDFCRELKERRPGGADDFFYAVGISAAEGIDEKPADRTHQTGASGKAVGCR